MIPGNGLIDKQQLTYLSNIDAANRILVLPDFDRKYII